MANSIIIIYFFALELADILIYDNIFNFIDKVFSFTQLMDSFSLFVNIIMVASTIIGYFFYLILKHFNKINVPVLERVHFVIYICVVFTSMDVIKVPLIVEIVTLIAFKSMAVLYTFVGDEFAKSLLDTFNYTFFQCLKHIGVLTMYLSMAMVGRKYIQCVSAVCWFIILMDKHVLLSKKRNLLDLAKSMCKNICGNGVERQEVQRHEMVTCTVLPLIQNDTCTNNVRSLRGDSFPMDKCTEMEECSFVSINNLDIRCATRDVTNDGKIFKEALFRNSIILYTTAFLFICITACELYTGIYLQTRTIHLLTENTLLYCNTFIIINFACMIELYFILWLQSHNTRIIRREYYILFTLLIIITIHSVIFNVSMKSLSFSISIILYAQFSVFSVLIFNQIRSNDFFTSISVADMDIIKFITGHGTQICLTPELLFRMILYPTLSSITIILNYDIFAVAILMCIIICRKICI